VIKTIFKLFAKLPIVFFYSVLKLLSIVLYKKVQQLKMVMKQNIALCFPELKAKEQDRLIQTSINKQLWLVATLPTVWLGTHKKFEHLILKQQGLQQLIEATKRDCATIILFPHIGNWELLCQYTARQLAPKKVYSLAKFNGKYDQLLSEFRNHHLFNNHLHPANVTGLRQFMKAFNNNQILFMAPDQVPQSEEYGCYAHFFGIETLSFQLLGLLLQRKKNIQVFMGFAIHNDQKYDIFIEKLENKQLFSKTLHQSISELNTILESYIKRWPSDNLWSYKRFKQSKPPIKYPMK